MRESIEPESRDAASRGALTRVLAGETRNALARVELAASEIARFEAVPSLQGRVQVIRSAVAEIDGLLAKIDMLRDVAHRTRPDSENFREVTAAALSRLSRVMSARGVSFAMGAPSLAEIDQPIRVALPVPVLEELVFGLARLVGNALSGPVEVEVEWSVREKFACLTLRSPTAPVSERPPIDRAVRLELDVSVTEWSGQLLTKVGEKTSEWAIALPAVSVTGPDDMTKEERERV